MWAKTRTGLEKSLTCGSLAFPIHQQNMETVSGLEGDRVARSKAPGFLNHCVEAPELCKHETNS
jgi:hypothetical protein